ncbi:MAG: S1/P1 nuclease [Bacteroidales bacterium]|nr:S1/P1 nuclease [Bacteroidales bacterium]
MKILFYLTIFPYISFGWGEKGHHIIVQIAKKHINKNIQDSVNKYLDDITWENASTWMDNIRRIPEYAFLKNWHYINIEQNMPYDSIKTGADNIYVQLQLTINRLKNKNILTKKQITYNLKILFHLIGDFHQPLHVGYGIDRGGNDVKIDFLGKHSNLHAIWDADIIEQTNISFELVNTLTNKKKYALSLKKSDINLMHWMIQTRKLLNFVYHFTNPINYSYINKSKSIIQHQLALAGIRLAIILNTIFS